MNLLFFNGTISGIRQAYHIFDTAVNDAGCVDCAENRELLFFHALSHIAMGMVRNDGAPIDSAMELAEEFDTVIIGNVIRTITIIEPDMPENRYGQPEAPANTEDLLNSLADFIDQSALPEIEGIIDELNLIDDSSEDRFRIFLTPDETSVFLDPGALPYTYDIEVDYGEVLLLTGARKVIMTKVEPLISAI